jgi:23S rRNA pseudouridine955/2504/2580 synthase
LSLLEVELLTGRTHQIRAQMSAIGHALVGDGKYAPRAQYQADRQNWQCLCSWRLRFCFCAPVCELEYLNGLDIAVKNVGFLRDCFPDFRLYEENF